MAAAVAAAPEDAVAVALGTQIVLRSAAVVVVAPSSMVQTVHRRGAVEDTSAVARAAATEITAIMPLALAAEAGEAALTVGISTIWEERMEPMAPTAVVEAGAATALPLGAAAVATAGLAEEEPPQECSGLISLALMEEMVDLAAVQALASAQKLMSTALPETGAVSEEALTAVAVAVAVELSEAPSSIKAVSL